MVAHERGEERLPRRLGTLEAVTIGIGGMIGGAIFEAIGVAAGMAGPSVVITFCFGALMASLTGYSYGKLGAKFPEAGGSFSYISRAFKGKSLRVLMGYLIWFAYISAAALYTLGFASYMRVFVPLVPDWFFAFGLVAAFTLVNLRGVKETGMAQNFMVSLKVLILLALVVVSLGSLHVDNFVPLFPFGVPSSLLALGIIFIGYEGFDIIGTSGEELKEPSKQIPRAIFLSIVVVSFLYISVSAVSIGVLGYDELRTSSAPLTRVALRAAGPLGALALGVGGVLSTASAFNAALYGASRISFSLSRSNVLPKQIGRLNRMASPYTAVAVTAVLAALLTTVSLLSEAAVKFAASLSSAAFIFVFLMVNLANYRLRHITKPHPAIMWLTICLYLLTMGLLYVADPTSWLFVGAWIAFALALDLLLRSKLIKWFYFGRGDYSGSGA
jgi:amino acid transporter